VRAPEVFTRWLLASPAIRVGSPVAALLLGVSGLFGGLDPIPLADRVGEVKPGTEVTAQPFALTLERAVVVDQIEDVINPLTTGNHLIVVLLDADEPRQGVTGQFASSDSRGAVEQRSPSVSASTNQDITSL
jgi:hypothetical protein